MLSLFASVSIFIIIFSICPFRQSIFLLLLHRSHQTEEVVTRGGIMENIVYFKLVQIVLTLTIIWQLLSLHQFCGTFADPKTFICDLSNGNCERFMLIGKDAETGEFGSMFDKLHNQFFMNSTNGQQIEGQQCKFFDFLAAKLPPAGRQCIPITITPFDGFFERIGIKRIPLYNDTLLIFSKLFACALMLLAYLCHDTMKMLRSVKEYDIYDFWYAIPSVIIWGYSVVYSFKLLFYWTDFWSCTNFQADHTNVPLATLVLSIVLVCLSIFEIVLHKFVLNVVTESANMMIIDQQPKKNESAFVCVNKSQ